MIHTRDAQDALGIAERQWEFLLQDFGVALSPDKSIENVVLAGMGGSALPGQFINSWPGLSVPFEISRNYDIPAYVNEKTLFISSSYSGNTEESLNAIEQAKAKGAKIIVIAAGGKLAELAKDGAYPYFAIPGGIQPRMSTFYFLVAFTQIFEELGLAKEGSLAELREAAQWLNGESRKWLPTVPAEQNQAKKIAQDIVGKNIVVYSGPKLFPAANKWKICFNENAKNIAWCNQYPELNHNEFLGWTSHPIEKPYAVVEIRSNLEHPRIQKRFEATEKLLSGKRPSPEIISAEGDSTLKQLLWAATLGDFTSLYLSLLNGLNPTPVDLIEKFKKELG
ncbi:bifunctional phosphoglucose/phosphomannose isomerase [Candidatus Saccharibacteria bacterium]|nr:bifunctional phosphoglucose/phosphomannose isomerase [Candidatus Saccharibacteria bacterium]